MNNSYTHNLNTDYLQKSTEDPTGFTYGTYSTAELVPYKDKAPMGDPNREAYVSSAVGGSISQVSFEGSKPKKRTGPTKAGGIRGKIKGFSRVSRRNLLRKFASINRTAFRAFEGRLIL